MFRSDGSAARAWWTYAPGRGRREGRGLEAVTGRCTTQAADSCAMWHMAVGSIRSRGGQRVALRRSRTARALTTTGRKDYVNPAR